MLKYFYNLYQYYLTVSGPEILDLDVDKAP